MKLVRGNRQYRESGFDTDATYSGRYSRGKILRSSCPDVDVASQGETFEEAYASLKEALELYFDDEDATIP